MMSVTAGCFSVVAIMPRWICNVVLMTMLAVQNPSAASSGVSSLDRRLATEGPVRLGILSTIGELSSTEVFSETVQALKRAWGRNIELSYYDLDTLPEAVRRKQLDFFISNAGTFSQMQTQGSPVIWLRGKFAKPMIPISVWAASFLSAVKIRRFARSKI